MKIIGFKKNIAMIMVISIAVSPSLQASWFDVSPTTKKWIFGSAFVACLAGFFICKKFGYYGSVKKEGGTNPLNTNGTDDEHSEMDHKHTEDRGDAHGNRVHFAPQSEQCSIGGTQYRVSTKKLDGGEKPRRLNSRK